MEKTIKILGNLSAIIGIILFVYPLLAITDLTLTHWQLFFISTSILISLAYIIYEIVSGPKKYRGAEDIKKYMRDWVNKSGRTVIFTRDMSWADDNDTKNGLRNKARNHELIICQPALTPFTEELKGLGAEIYDYSGIDFVPKSRFTFIHYSTASSKVAIGRKDSNHIHYIDEISNGDNNQYNLAEDLVNLVKAIQ